MTTTESFFVPFATGVFVGIVYCVLVAVNIWDNPRDAGKLWTFIFWIAIPTVIAGGFILWR